MILHYKLTFLDYWHLGSGLSSGAKLDSSVIKDSNNITYLPGKTLKGLTKEMVELLQKESTFLDKLHFGNATLKKEVYNEVVSNQLQDNLYDVIASTQIKDGIAVDDSLREIEVTIPLTLEGKVLNITSKEEFETLKKALLMIKRVGLNRNRGLGRCKFEVEMA